MQKTTFSIHGSLEQFSIECRKTKTKAINPANHEGPGKYGEPIKTRRNYMYMRSAG